MAAAQPVAAAPVQMGGGGNGTICVEFSDGTMVGYDKLRRTMILTGKFNGALSTTQMGQIPARPTPSAVVGEGGKVVIAEEAPAVARTHEASVVKLSYQKGLMGAANWQNRYLKVGETAISYHLNANTPALKSFNLSKGMEVAVVDEHTPARKDRYQDQDSPGVIGLMTQPMGAVLEKRSKPIGKNHCLELICPPQIGNILNTVTQSSAVGLAFGGGMKNIQNSQGRTYYFAFPSREEAEVCAVIVKENIRALPVGAGSAGGAYGGVDTMLNGALAMQKGMADAVDPTKSLEWYKNSLGTEVLMNELFDGLTNFYNQLDASGIPHP